MHVTEPARGQRLARLTENSHLAQRLGGCAAVPAGHHLGLELGLDALRLTRRGRITTYLKVRQPRNRQYR
jgi:hypothetical protein